MVERDEVGMQAQMLHNTSAVAVVIAFCFFFWFVQSWCVCEFCGFVVVVGVNGMQSVPPQAKNGERKKLHIILALHTKWSPSFGNMILTNLIIASS